MPSVSSALISSKPWNVPVTSTIALSKSSVHTGIWYFQFWTYVMFPCIVWMWSLSLSNHTRPDHAPIAIVIQSEAFETFDISKEPISKTSRFWIFSYKWGCNWLGAIKGMVLWSRGFSRGSLFKTWPKPETAHEKPLAPRVVGQRNEAPRHTREKTSGTQECS